MALPALIGGIVKLGTTWLSNRSEKQQARHERDLRVIAGDQSADTAASSGMEASYKDEFLTLIFSIPLIVIFWESVWGDPESVQQVKAAFQAMGELPDWYQYAFLGCVIATFGLRGMAKFLVNRR
tara:strand:+ start:103 stop:477 length:375 start_codon:yes stop_codon:yes gene_type:complete